MSVLQLPPATIPGSEHDAPLLLTAGPHRYWSASAFAETVLAEFEAAKDAGDVKAQRDRFYVLAAYFRRTLAILHSAFERRREDLVAASLQNLVVLQRALAAMRRLAPDEAQSTLALETGTHHRLNRDLVHQVLRDARRPLGLITIQRRFNQLDLFADARGAAIEEALRELVESGHAAQRRGRYAATRLPYLEADVERAALSMLLGPTLARQLADAGYEALSQALRHRQGFRERFIAATGFGAGTASLALAAAAALAPPSAALHPGGLYRHASLGGSAHPRPYQRLLHGILRANGYAAQVIEAPAGCGKTLIGMLCMEDWLRTMGPGQSIAVFVPTVNYQRQWLAELCFKEHGLRLSPSSVFAGSLRELDACRKSGGRPAVLLLTYAALSRAAHGVGGGFDAGGVERFLQGNDVRHLILDEVHGAVDEPQSLEANAVRVFREWLRDGSIASLIGFSGTLTGFRRQLESLGLELAYVLPAAELIGQGWVAPFAEFGAPFSYSAREREIAQLIAGYRSLLLDYWRCVGVENLKRWFADVPLEERVRLGALLGMYAGRPEQRELILRRLQQWQADPALPLSQATLVVIVQLANGWPDVQLLTRAGRLDDFDAYAPAFERIRYRLRALLPPGRLAQLLEASCFGQSVPAKRFAPGAERRPRPAEARDSLATTFLGVYLALRGWSRQAGEGRVSAVRSILAAERETRSVTGVIVFDTPAPLEWKAGRANPGYRGAGGLFVDLLGDASVTPMAALASAVYLPDYPGDPLQERIAAWIMRRVVLEEQGDSLFRLLAASGRPDGRPSDALRSYFLELYSGFVAGLACGGATTIAALEHQVLRPFARRAAAAGRERARSSSRGVSVDSQHVAGFIRGVRDYAAIAAAFRAARPVQVSQGSGCLLTARVVPVGRGQRRQILLDLTARIVDAPELPVDLVIVSDWARTGWNVVTPNVLIDATATRDVNAWQQLRGRAMRPAPTWSEAAERLTRRLLLAASADSAFAGSRAPAVLSQLPRDEARAAAAILGPRAIRDMQGAAAAEDAAVSVLLARNKVTHVYELVRSFGSLSQVEYNRHTRAWERRKAIRAKHAREYAVRPGDGVYTRGVSHAPLVVGEDPRTDSPAEFRARLRQTLSDVDARIVRGWLAAATPPAPRP